MRASDPVPQWREGIRNKNDTSSVSKLLRPELPLSRHGRDVPFKGREMVAYDDILTRSSGNYIQYSQLRGSRIFVRLASVIVNLQVSIDRAKYRDKRPIHQPVTAWQDSNEGRGSREVFFLDKCPIYRLCE
ncbi:hypothetical protein LguiA_002715 [Lonicera macranthoides]